MVSARGWVSFSLNIQFILMPLGAVMKVCLFVFLSYLIFFVAFVIYNFIRLCIAYLGGESAILASLSGTPIPYEREGGRGLNVGGAREE